MVQCCMEVVGEIEKNGLEIMLNQDIEDETDEYEVEPMVDDVVDISGDYIIQDDE